MNTKESNIVKYEKDIVRKAFEFAYRAYAEAKSMRSFKPVAFVLGFSIYYEMKYFCCEVFGYSAWNNQNGKESLFGLPIRVTENNKYEISLELDVFTCDFEKEFILMEGALDNEKTT